jgi:hypothetical protein
MTDGAVESITESIFCFALDTNSTSALLSFECHKVPLSFRLHYHYYYLK